MKENIFSPVVSMAAQGVFAAGSAAIAIEVAPSRAEIALAAFAGAFVAALMTIKPAIVSKDHEDVIRYSVLSIFTFMIGFLLSFVLGPFLFPALKPILDSFLSISYDVQIFSFILSFFGERIASILWELDLSRLKEVIFKKKV